MSTPLMRSGAEQNRPSGDDTSSATEVDRYVTADSDPAQDRAVARARLGPGLVIEGPPGTGKSQTIVNLVADAIGRKSSLLIVCQKQAALDVVYKRLEREGLGADHAAGGQLDLRLEVQLELGAREAEQDLTLRDRRPAGERVGGGARRTAAPRGRRQLPHRRGERRSPCRSA